MLIVVCKRRVWGFLAPGDCDCRLRACTHVVKFPQNIVRVNTHPTNVSLLILIYLSYKAL
jgi:hypothetical protein